jgi:hypothetical protein
VENVTSASAWWWLPAIGLMAAGIAGSVLPVLPGTILVLAGVVLGAWIDGFEKVSVTAVVAIAVLGVAAWITDYVAGLLGARQAGASRAAVVGATVGTLFGVFTGFVGLLFMPLLGALLGEYWAQRQRLGGFASADDHLAAGRQATRVGMATWVGMLLGIVVKLVLTLLMVGGFALAYFF